MNYTLLSSKDLLNLNIVEVNHTQYQVTTAKLPFIMELLTMDIFMKVKCIVALKIHISAFTIHLVGLVGVSTWIVKTTTNVVRIVVFLYYT